MSFPSACRSTSSWAGHWVHLTPRTLLKHQLSPLHLKSIWAGFCLHFIYAHLHKMPWHDVLGRHTDPGDHRLACLPLAILPLVGMECTLSCLADPTNSALKGDIFLLEVCPQYLSTHLMVQLNGAITCVALVGHAVRGTRRPPYTIFTILCSLGQRAPLTLCLMGPKCRLCPWQTMLPYTRLQLIMVYNFYICPWNPVAPCSPGTLSYLGPDKGLGSLPLA